MALFDLILNQTLELQEVKDYVELFEPMFEALNVDLDDYDWEMTDLESMQDLGCVRVFILGNLIFAAQDAGIFPYFMDADDFDFTDGVHFDIANYDDDKADEIRTALKEFEDKTGVEVSIEE